MRDIAAVFARYGLGLSEAAWSLAPAEQVEKLAQAARAQAFHQLAEALGQVVDHCHKQAEDSRVKAGLLTRVGGR